MAVPTVCWRITKPRKGSIADAMQAQAQARMFVAATTRIRGAVSTVAALAWLVGGCASTAPMGPVDVTRAQIERLTVGDEAGASALFTPDVRVKAPQWPARADLPASGSVVEVERTAMWSGGRELELVRTTNGWAIRHGVLALFRVDSAEGALAAFGRALEARDIGLVTALMPEESRKLLLPGTFEKAFASREAAWRELGRAINLANGQTNGARVTWAARDGDRAEAVVTVGEGKGASEQRVVLVREATGWKVFDVQPWSGYIAP